MVTRTSGKAQRPDETWQVGAQPRYHRSDRKSAVDAQLLDGTVWVPASTTKVGGTSKPTATMKSVEGWGGTWGVGVVGRGRERK